MQKVRHDKRLGSNIRKLRINADMTQEQVVAKMQIAGCSISRSIYSQMENGTYNLRVSELAVLCRIFSADFNALFAGVCSGEDAQEE